ncbi:MAG: PspA/IM30 family protein [Alphaproteobacteria bacterium]|nr:PspA/IM30 family protein [Alphaproteobacteria bacterium]
MSENIASRVSRIVSGTANMLVDAVENMAPEVIMDEAIREVDRAIDAVRAELGKVIASGHMANRRLIEENGKHEELTEKIQMALDKKREELAETAVEQLIDIEAQIPVLESSIVDSKEAQAELERYIAALQGRKRELQKELVHYKQAVAASGAPGSPDGGGGKGKDVGGAVRRAESAFERIVGATGVPGSTPMPDRASAAKRAELDELHRTNRVKERLAAFKAEKGK